MKTLRRLFYTVLTSTFILTGCGGGGGGAAATGPSYSGATTPVAIDISNAETIGTKTTEGSQQAITQQTANNANPYAISITSGNSEINSILVGIAKNIGGNIQNINTPLAITVSYTDLGYPFCGGSVTVSDSFVNSISNTGTLNGSMTFNNLCYTDATLGNITMNGSITFTETVSQISIQYSNFSINDGSGTETINMTVTCDVNLLSCSISADFEGADGKVYRIANMTVTEVTTGTYNVSASFYHPDYGSVTMNATSITLGCANGQPNGGTITYTGASGSSGTITFRADCTGYDGTYDDGAVSAGGYSGSWL